MESVIAALVTDVLTPVGVLVSNSRSRVIAGEFGNGDARCRALESAYDAVQARVNELLGVGGGGSSVGSGSGGTDIDAPARAVIRGDYGNGAERKRHLGSKYAAVQARANEILLWYTRTPPPARPWTGTGALASRWLAGRGGAGRP